MDNLINELDRIPLALVQAGSFIGSANFSVQTFLQSLKMSRDTLSRLPPVEDDDTDKRKNIRTTWTLSLRQLNDADGEGSQLHHNAAKLMFLLCHLTLEIFGMDS